MSEPQRLTRELLLKAMQDAHDGSQREAERAQRYAEFYESIPEHLHDHRDVVIAATVIGEGQPVHPRHAALIQARLEAVLASEGDAPTEQTS